MKKLKPARKIRDDGKETQAAIIETAGKLIANQGYDKNFDSREKLYLEVLRQVYTYFWSVTELKELEEKISAEETISMILNLLAEVAQKKGNWKIRVLLRELLSPSDFAKKIVAEEVLPKLNLLTKIFSEYTGLPADSPKLHAKIIGTFAPFYLREKKF